jgi:hypothetical protein
MYGKPIRATVAAPSMERWKNMGELRISDFGFRIADADDVS